MEGPYEKLVCKMWETLVEKGIGSLFQLLYMDWIANVQRQIARKDALSLEQTELDRQAIRAGLKALGSKGDLVLISNAAQHSAQPGPMLQGPSGAALTPEQAMQIAQSNAMRESLRKEINVALAVLHADEHLAQDAQEPSDKTIDEDWLFAWRDCAGRVGAEQLQQLWGRLLAGEFKSPGQYSLRTLEFLRTLSKQDAEDISRLGPYVVSDLIADSQQSHLETKGVSFGFLLRMQTLGLVSGVESEGIECGFKNLKKKTFQQSLVSSSKALFVIHDDPIRECKLSSTIPLTELGEQLLSLGKFEADVEYLTLVGKEIVAQGCRVELGDWVLSADGRGHCLNRVPIEM